MPDAVCMVYGKLLFMDRDRAVLRHYLFLHPELEDQSGLSLAEEQCGPGEGAVQKYPEVTKYTKQLFMHRLGSFFQFQVTPFLVYAFVSLQMAAYFGNYSTIVEKLHLLVNNLLGSTEASVGNLIAEGNAGKSARCSVNCFPCAC